MGKQNKQDLVTKSNMLIEANYRLGVTEQKIILFLASKIQTTDSEFKTYTLSIKEFAKMVGLKGQSMYSEIKKITFELMKKAFQIRITNKTIQSSWFSYVAYNDHKGTVDIRFDPFLKPYLLELKREFTSYKLSNVATLKSTYSIRLYELLKQYEKLGDRTFELEGLRTCLGADDIYPVYANFKQRVILPAQKELAKKTDISFEFTEEKVGRKIGKITFKIMGKDSEKMNQKESGFLERTAQILKEYGFSIPNKVINGWEKFGEERVNAVLEQIKDSNHIESPAAYITTVLQRSMLMETDEADIGAEDIIGSVMKEIRNQYSKSVDVTPEWLLKEDFIKLLKQKLSVTDQEANVIWKEKKEKLISDIRGIRERNILKRA